MALPLITIAGLCCIVLWPAPILILALLGLVLLGLVKLLATNAERAEAANQELNAKVAAMSPEARADLYRRLSRSDWLFRKR